MKTMFGIPLLSVFFLLTIINCSTNGSSGGTTTTTGGFGGGPPGGGGSQSCTLPSGVKSYTNLAYASDSSAQKLDVILPSAAAPAGGYPLVIRIHGGAFSGGDKQGEECDSMASAIYAKGWALASVNYRLSGEAAFPAGLQDVRAAVRYLRANAATYNLNTSKFAAWGESAGGYFAVALGVLGDQNISTVAGTANATSSAVTSNANQSNAVIAVVDFFGPTNFTKMDAEQTAHPPSSCPTACSSQSASAPSATCWQQHNPSDSPESTWLGVAVSNTTNATVTASILSNYTANNSNLPFFFLRHGTDDCQVPYSQDADFTSSIGDASHYDAALLNGYSHGDSRFSSDGVTLPAAISALAKYL